MRLPRLLLVLALTVPLAGCGQEPDDGTDPAADDSVAPETTSLASSPSYQVRDSDCPQGWTGLRVTTDADAEIDYLDDMPACVNAAGDTTYLQNRSAAVWTLHSVSQRVGRVTPADQRAGEQVSFLQAVQGQRDTAILVPGAAVTVDLPPDEVEWLIDLPLSVGWEAHGLVLDTIEGAGQAAGLAALRRQSQAGVALATCAVTATAYADEVEGLADADAVDVMLTGIGLSATSSACYTESLAVGTVDDAGRRVSLAHELERLRGQTATLQSLDTRLGYAQRASKVLQYGLAFLR